MEDAVDFRPGFRLSEIDVGVLMLGILASVLLARFDESFARFELSSFLRSVTWRRLGMAAQDHAGEKTGLEVGSCS